MSEGPGEETQALSVAPAYATGSVRAPGWVLGGRYRVLDRLGVGGMAEVFRAHDEQLDRDVAVKVFRTPVEEPGNAQAPERRETELRALAQLSHPNLITLYDANLAGPDPAFLVTELVIGPNLADRLSEGPLPEDLVRTIGTQIADALAYVHSSGMVHRDVKPANILLGTDGADPETAAIRARLSDFGIVRVIDGARMTAADFTLGTASYIAPEQARGADVSAAADVYALGLVLIEMLTGVRSFDGPFHEAVAARLVRAPEIPPGLPAPWPGLLAAMTAIDPARRPSAAQVADALRTFSAPAPLPPPIFAGPDDATVFTAPVAVPPASAPLLAAADAPPEEPPRSHRGVALAAAALAFIAVIATALVLLLKPSSHAPITPQGDTTAPTRTAGQSGPSGPSRSGRQGVPVTAGGSGVQSGAAGSGATSGASSSGATPSAGSSSTHATTHSSPPPTHSTSARPSRSSTSARPSSSVPRSSTARTTTAPPSTSPATSSSAAAVSGGPGSGSVAALPSGGP